MYEIDVEPQSSSADVDIRALIRSIETGLGAEDVAGAVLSVTLVDNLTIHQLNRQHLDHDYPTDVISFQLDWRHPERTSPGTEADGRAAGAQIEGEIVASVEYAAAEADRHGWSLQSELTLYVIHGMLHVCGYDDLTPAEKTVMRARESAVFQQLGDEIIPRHPDNEASTRSSGETAE